MSNLKKKAVSLDEPKRFLKKHPEVKSFDIVMHDCNAVGRGKIIRRHELLKLYESGRQFPLSLLGMDITGEDVPDTGLILEQGDGDIKALISPSPCSKIKPVSGTSSPVISIPSNDRGNCLPDS